MCAEKYRKARSEKAKAFWIDEWHSEQTIFDIINDSLPERYKVKLESRSYRDGASKEGKTLEEFRRKLKTRRRSA